MVGRWIVGVGAKEGERGRGKDGKTYEGWWEERGKGESERDLKTLSEKMGRTEERDNVVYVSGK